MGDLGVEQGFGKAVVRNAVAEHAAQLGALLVHGYGMAHAGKVVRRGKAARAAADNRNLLAGRLADFGGTVGGFVIAGVALQAADVHRRIDEAATAGVLAGVLAYVCAGAGEGVVFADELNGIVETPGLDQCDVSGDVDVCGASLNAGNGMVGRAHATAFGMQLVVVAEGAHAGKGHFSCLGANGAVGRDAHVFSKGFDAGKVGLGCRSVEHAVEQRLDLRQADAAGDALAARLRAAQGNEAARHIDGAGTLRMRNKTTGHILAHAAHGLLRFARGTDFQWAHGILLGL